MRYSETATINDLAHFVDKQFFADEIECEEYDFFHAVCEKFTRKQK